MELLVLGGTAWLGREVARQAVAAGDTVTCLARGEAGPVADGATLVAADRRRPGAYDALLDRDWDAVVEISWQPGFVREALAALGPRTAHWTLVSSGSVYTDHARAGDDESAPVADPFDGDEATRDDYSGAKIACEQEARAAVGDCLLVARAGLIAGPGDDTDRTGAWVARAAREPASPMLVPANLDLPTQCIDVRDLAGWMLACAREDVTGTYDAVGPVLPLGEWIDLARDVAGHTGGVVEADPAWLVEQGVAEWAGPDSLAMWLNDPTWFGFSARTGAAALATGLAHRPRRTVMEDLLAWERAEGLDRPRKAGLSPEREAALLAALVKSGQPVAEDSRDT